MEKYCTYKGRGYKHEDTCEFSQTEAQKSCGLYQYFDFLVKEYGGQENNKVKNKGK